MSPRAWCLACLALVGCATTKVVVAPPPPPPPPYRPAPVPEPLPPVTRAKPTAVTRTLRNGLKVVVVPDRRARLVKLRLFFADGSAVEHEGNAGVTAFALGLLGDRFDRHDDGGELIDHSEKSARYLALVKGAQLHFDVTPDVAVVALDGYSRDAAALVTLLDDVITDRRQGAESFQARSQGAVDLVNELELTDGLALDQFLSQLAFGADHPYARPVFGTATSLEHVGLEDVIERQASLLTPVGSTLLIVGDVAPEAMHALAARSFGDWEGAAPARVRFDAPRVAKRRGVVFLPRKPSRNTLVCLTRPLTDLKSAPRVAARLAVAVVGQARIAETLREKLGLTYGVTAQVVERRAATAMAVCSRVRSADAIQATRLMLEAFTALAAEPPSLQEVDRARAQLVTSLETAQDDLDGVVAAWTTAAVLGRPAPSDDDVQAAKAVTLEQVQAAARALANRDTLQVIVSGEKAMAEATARANELGPLQVPKLKKVEAE